ncbi:hypothetical protein [uncultured Sphingomonas sp.]|uniref:hypothetical protein n=1 Tax=uncultured Sphingomonas sp. TaxID=158754 RepID=UPI0025FFB295|nr:hypothetical protein [uncultured Sphingomonas sp.]
MSFSDRPTVSPLAAAGCLLFGIVGAIIVGLLAVGAALGHCAPQPDGTGCENSGLIDFLMFPGSLIVALLGGIWLARFVTRDRN